jgi:hypothetical protein
MPTTTTTDGEYSLYVRRYAPFASFGGGFEGDNRGFSTSLTATSRTAGIATFTLGSTTGFRGYSTGSSWVGPWQVRKSLPWSSIGRVVGDVRVEIRNVVGIPNGISFTVHTYGNLPFKDILLHKSIAGAIDSAKKAMWPDARRLEGTPDIDTFLDLRTTLAGGRLVFEGVARGDGFPNAEVFVLDPASKALALLDYRARIGMTNGVADPYLRLAGNHDNNRLASFRKEIALNADGTFGRGYLGSPLVVQET